MIKIGLLLGCAIALAGCRNHTSGVTKTESRAVGDFDSVEVHNGISADIRIGESGPIEVEADTEELTEIVTEVKGHQLEVHFKGSIHFGGSRVQVKIPAKDVSAVKVSSGATVDVAGFKDDTCAVSASSGSTVHASGTAKTLTVSATAGSTVDLAKLAVDDATVNATAGSTVRVQVKSSVKGSATAGSTVDVSGGPSERSVTTTSGANVNYR